MMPCTKCTVLCTVSTRSEAPQVQGWGVCACLETALVKESKRPLYQRRWGL